jgi:hypothetical protein
MNLRKELIMSNVYELPMNYRTKLDENIGPRQAIELLTNVFIEGDEEDMLEDEKQYNILEIEKLLEGMSLSQTEAVLENVRNILW